MMLSSLLIATLLCVAIVTVVGQTQDNTAPGFLINGLLDYTPFMPNSELVVQIVGVNATAQFVNQYNDNITLVVNDQPLLFIAIGATTPYFSIIPFGVQYWFIDSNNTAISQKLSFNNAPANNFVVVTVATGSVTIANTPNQYWGLLEPSGNSSTIYLSSCEIAVDNTNLTCGAFDTDFSLPEFNYALDYQFVLRIQTSPAVIPVDGGLVPLMPGELQLAQFYYQMTPGWTNTVNLTLDANYITVFGLFNVSETYQCSFTFSGDGATHLTPAVAPSADAKSVHCNIVKEQMFNVSTFKDEDQTVTVAIVGVSYAGANRHGLTINYSSLPGSSGDKPKNHLMWALIGGGVGLAIIIVIIAIVAIKRSKRSQYQSV